MAYSSLTPACSGRPQAAAADAERWASSAKPRGAQVKRRTFVATVGIAGLLSLAARAQSRPARVAFVNLANPEPYWTFLREALRDLGYVDGKNLQLDYRSADGKLEVLAAHATEIGRSGVD